MLDLQFERRRLSIPAQSSLSRGLPRDSREDDVLTGWRVLRDNARSNVRLQESDQHLINHDAAGISYRLSAIVRVGSGSKEETRNWVICVRCITYPDNLGGGIIGTRTTMQVSAEVCECATLAIRQCSASPQRGLRRCRLLPGYSITAAALRLVTCGDMFTGRCLPIFARRSCRALRTRCPLGRPPCPI